MLLHIQVPEGIDSEWHLLQDGKPVLRSNQQIQTYLPLEAGVYRVEVYLREGSALDKDCPWILSNPIFLRK
jgi:hypothetical protein